MPVIRQFHGKIFISTIKLLEQQIANPAMRIRFLPTIMPGNVPPVMVPRTGQVYLLITILQEQLIASPAIPRMNPTTIILVRVQTAIAQVVGVMPNLVTRGKTIAHPVIQVMHQRTTITVNVPRAIQLQVGGVLQTPMLV